MRIRAQIDLIATANGGRSTPIGSDYRPNHALWPDGSMHIGKVFFDRDLRLNPGESAEVVIDFFDDPRLVGCLTPGSTWPIQEGARLIGHGTVLEVLG